MTALRRVLRAPGLIVLVVAIQLVVALILGSGVRAAVGASLVPYSLATDGHLLGATFELFGDHPGLPVGFRQVAVGSSAIALVLWILLAAPVIHRLRSKTPAARLAALAFSQLPAIGVTTLWHLALRIVLLAALGLLTAPLLDHGAWGLLGVAATAVALAISTCALDLARCHVVLHGARGFHYSTALRAYREAVRRPAVLVPSMLLSFGQWTCVAGAVAVAMVMAGAGGTIWLVRGLAVLGVVLGLTRVAVAVEAGFDRTGRG
ncbi:MAG: hypothetical protein GY719_16735 [bacterium]|nr:hypothetical protein [bacterium]